MKYHHCVDFHLVSSFLFYRVHRLICVPPSFCDPRRLCRLDGATPFSGGDGDLTIHLPPTQFSPGSVLVCVDVFDADVFHLLDL